MQGIIVPIITPFNDDGNLYKKGIEEIIHYLYRKEIEGLWLLGSYGSFPLMSVEERMHFAEIAIPLAHKLGMTCVVNISNPSTKIAVQLTKHAEEIGADGLASVVPFYYASSHYTENNIITYYEAIINNTKLPLIYYNNEKTTGYSPSIGLIKHLLEIGVYGLKDQADYATMAERIELLKQIRPEGVYFSGNTSICLQGYLLGAQGVVSGTALAFPGLVKKLEQAFNKKDIDEAIRLQDLVLKIRKVQGRYVGRSVSCYDILAAKGVEVGTCRSPWVRMKQEQAREVIAEIEVLEAQI